MQSRSIRPLVALCAVAALGIPVAGASAHGKGSEHGKGPHMRALNVRGTVAAVGDGTVDVVVEGANHHGSGLRGQTVTVDVTAARIVVADSNADGSRDLSDVAVGDRVLVQSRIAKGSAPDPAQPLVAKRVVDKGATDATGDGDTGDTTDPAETP